MTTGTTDDPFPPPVRPCCMQRHWGPVCPDGRVMCQLCYDRFEVKDLHVCEDGTPEDVCVPCAEHDQEMVRRKEAGEPPFG